MRRADPGPGAGERVRLGRRGSRALEQFRDAEVGNLHAALGIEQQVLRLDVPMQHPLRVRGLQRLANRRDEGQRLLRREAPGSQRLAKVGSVHELHQQEAEPAGLPEPMHAHDVGMPQPRERAGFALEAFHKGRIGGQFPGQHLERRDPARIPFPHPVHTTHAARAQVPEHFQLGESRGDLRQGRRLPYLGSKTRIRRRIRPVQETARAQTTRGPVGNGGQASRTGSRGLF